MSTIVLGERRKYKVSIPSLGKEYELTKPTFAEQEAYHDALSTDGGNKFTVMIKFLGSMGMPEDAVKQLNMDEYAELIEAVVGAKKN